MMDVMFCTAFCFTLLFLAALASYLFAGRILHKSIC